MDYPVIFMALIKPRCTSIVKVKWWRCGQNESKRERKTSSDNSIFIDNVQIRRIFQAHHQKRDQA